MQKENYPQKPEWNYQIIGQRYEPEEDREELKMNRTIIIIITIMTIMIMTTMKIDLTKKIMKKEK